MKLNMGAGMKPQEGYINYDMAKLPGIDLVHKYTGVLPFRKESFDEIYAEHFLEHIPDLITLMNECHRILKQGGKFVIKVPWCQGEWAAGDCTHVRQFNHLTFEPFTTKFDYYGTRIGVIGKWKLNNIELCHNNDYPFSYMKWLKDVGLSTIVAMDVELEKE